MLSFSCTKSCNAPIQGDFQESLHFNRLSLTAFGRGPMHRRPRSQYPKSLEDRKERFSTSLACSALRMYYLYGTFVWYFRLLVENLSLLKALVPLDYPLRALPRLFKSKRTLGRLGSSFLLSKVFQESWIFPHGLFQGLLKQEKGIPSKVKAKCTL